MRSETSLRVFVALELPPRELALVGDLVGRLRKFGARVSWVPTTSVHVTLAFLGNIELDKVASVTAAVTSACDGVGTFQIAVQGTGTFPSPARAKVLWAGIRGDVDALESLQRRTSAELRAAGFSLDDKPFRPHITIGRVKDARGPEFSSVLRELHEAKLEGRPFAVDSVTVIRSELLPSGARYTPLARIGLSGRS